MRRLNTIIAIPAVLLLVLFSGRNLLAGRDGLNEALLTLLHLPSEACGEQSRTNRNPKSLDSNPHSAIRNQKFEKTDVLQTVYKLQMPFIANEGQANEEVRFYANTFGGTVFVTKDGELVYALAGKDKGQETGGRRQGTGVGEMGYGPRIIENEMRSSFKVSDLFKISYRDPISKIVSPSLVQSCRLNQNVSVQATSLNQHGVQRLKGKNDRKHETGRGGVTPTLQGSKASIQECGGEWHSPNEIPLAGEGKGEGVSVLALNEANVPHPVQGMDRMSGVTIKEEFVNGKIGEIQGINKAMAKVNYFRGRDSSKWKRNISTYDMVTLGEVYEGIELRLKAYGNNVEKLFYVKPGADLNEIKIRLSGLQPSENPPPCPL
ncbi:MAG: hypothetical protein B6D35_12205 [Candidatus Brocadia sp. UTAMX2]|jgi:hypothetical protein|nr:MAG: hypothetical protein B6D35_12205 [Candidatus Brocadia sp. UTAMX2]